MQKDYHARILTAVKPKEWIKFSDITKRLKLNSYGSTSTHYYRAWLDLLASGRFQESIDGTFRINQ